MARPAPLFPPLRGPGTALAKCQTYRKQEESKLSFFDVVLGIVFLPATAGFLFGPILVLAGLCGIVSEPPSSSPWQVLLVGAAWIGSALICSRLMRCSHKAPYRLRLVGAD